MEDMPAASGAALCNNTEEVLMQVEQTLILIMR